MVLKKRFEARTISFEVPVVPRAPRSVRWRGHHKKIPDGKSICPIELLASLAGKLLQESESSSASNNASDEKNPLSLCKDGIKEERQHVDNPLKVESHDLGSCEEISFVAEHNFVQKERKCKFESCLLAEGDHSQECTSVICRSSSLDKVRSYTKPMAFDNAEGVHLNSGTESVRVESTPESIFKDLFRGRSVVTNVHKIKFQKLSCREPARTTSSPRHRTDTNLVGRDDHENFSRMNKCSNRVKSFRYQQWAGDHRLRKLLSSKYWRPTLKLKEYKFSKADGDVKPMLVGYKRKAIHQRARYLGDYLYNKRKFFDRGSIVTTGAVVSGESKSNLPKKSMNAEEGILVEEGGVSTSISDGRVPLHIKDNNVRFSIKSFKIPELFIDVPETDTVGSLKRTIVEAITALLGSGLRVGVVLRGKKIRDDNRTLLQTGLSCQENLEKLGFTLEPTLENPQLAAAVSENPPLVTLSDESLQLTRVQEANLSEIGVSSVVSDASNHIVHNASENIPSIPDDLVDNDTTDCTALIPLSALCMEPLSIVPMNQKNKRSELSQRRIRRPFSVTEVEALVHAIEELGTGRWRDVKLRAFENADHRTYVDLKDKWKTLVHTASILPQQRRGEPVPQDLLDRVLSAHAYWSQHLGKQHTKHPLPPPPRVSKSESPNHHPVSEEQIVGSGCNCNAVQI